MTEYTLTEAERAALLELEQVVRKAQEAAALADAQAVGAIRLILRQQSLEGTWNLTDDRTKLVLDESKPKQ